MIGQILGLTLLAALAGAAAEPPAAVGGLMLERRLVADPGHAGEDSAGYLIVRNPGAAEDRLLSVTCACASRVELHRIDRSGPSPRMATDPDWAVPAAGQLEVRPGSPLHLMLINFDPARAVDGKVRLTLTFRDAGAVQADFALAPDSRAAWAAFD